MEDESHETRAFILAFLSVIWAVLVFSYFRTNLDPYLTSLFVIGVSISYFAHELAHWFGAKRAGYDFEFKLDKWGFPLTILVPVVTLGYMMFFFPLAARFEKIKYSTQEHWAYNVSLPGPGINIVLLIIFTVISTDPFFRIIGLMNGAFAFWNMIPRGTDGENIWVASKTFWAFLMIVWGGFMYANVFGVSTGDIIFFFTNFSGILFVALIGFIFLAIVLGLFGIKLHKS